MAQASVFLTALLLLSTSCSSTQQAQGVELIYVDGCALVIEGLTLEQVQEVTREWSFDQDCKVRVISTVE